MGKEDVKATVRKEVKAMLIHKKQVTGRSVSELIEYAVINMPYIPPKKKNKNEKLI